jgi:hypothetical protein
MVYRTVVLMVLLASLSTIIGCGDSGLTLVPLTGTITLDGEPLPFKSLTLIPLEGTPGPGASGYSDGEGNYSLRAMVSGAIKDYPGCPPGKYKVVVTEPVVPLSDADFADTPVAASEGDEPAVAIAMTGPPSKRPVKGSVPNVYSSSTTSPLVVEVVVGNLTADIELKSR